MCFITLIIIIIIQFSVFLNKMFFNVYGCVTVVKAARAAGARGHSAEGRREETPSRVEKVSRWSRHAKRCAKVHLMSMRLAVLLLLCCHLSKMVREQQMSQLVCQRNTEGNSKY